MEWDDLRIFLTAVRAGSYTHAARQLGINRTTIGRRVDALERAIGHNLFIETPTGPEPSAEGKLLLDAAARMEAEVERLDRGLGQVGTFQGPIRIASSAGIAAEFLDEFAAYQRQQPTVTIELIGALDPLEAVTHRRADLAIALVRRPPRRLAGTMVGTISQADYRRSGGEMGPRLGWGREIEAAIPGQWTVANPIGDDCGARFNSWPQLKQAVLAGLGHASLWCFSGDAEPSLERLSPPDARHDSALWLLHRSVTPPALRLQDLVSFLDEALRKRIA